MYCKLAVLLVPKQHKLEHTSVISGLSDEQIEAYLADIQDRIDRKAGKQVKVIEGTVEPTAVETPAPPAELEPPMRRSNRLMMEADTAIGPWERKPGKRKVPSSSDADGVP